MLVTSANKLPRLKSAKSLAFDLETKDPDLKTLGPGVRRDGRVLGIAMATADRQSWYVPLNAKLSPEKVWKWCAEALDGAEVLGANIGYDLDYAVENGVPMPEHVRDVLHAGRLLDMQGKFPSLEELLQKYMGIGKTGDDLWDWVKEHGTKAKPITQLDIAPPELVAEYAEGDVLELHGVLAILKPLMEKRSCWDWYGVESELLPYLIEMRRRGIRVDVEKAERLQEQFGTQYYRLYNEIAHEFYGDVWESLTTKQKSDTLNINSGPSMGKLYEKVGIALPRTPISDQPSLTKNWLENRDDDLSRKIRRLRALGKIKSTFIDSYILKHQVNGRIHPELNQLFPRTLRFSSSNPNEQNIPKRDEELAPMIRGLFLPEEDEDWGRHDYDQQEYRLAVHFAMGPGATEAREAYNNDPDTDFHNLVWSWLPQIDSRSTVKNANFAKIYRAGRKVFAETLGVSKEEGDPIFDMYDENLPFMGHTAQVAENMAKTRGYVRPLLRDMRMYFDYWCIDDWNLRNILKWDHELFKRSFETKEDAAKASEIFVEEYNVDTDNLVKLPVGRSKIAKADTYKAFNRVVQPSGAQLMKLGMVLLRRSGAHKILGPAIVSVHDELGLSVPRTLEGRQAFEEAARCLIAAEEGKLSVPLKIGSEIGPDWGHMEPIEDLNAWVGEG